QFQAALGSCAGLGKMPLLEQRLAQSAMGVGELGVEAEGFVVGGDGLVYLALGLQGVAEVVVGLGVLGVETECFTVGVEGVVYLALGLQGVAEVGAYDTAIGPHRQRCPEEADPFRSSIRFLSRS